MSESSPTTGRRRSALSRLAVASLLAAAGVVGLVTAPSAAEDQDDDVPPAREPVAELRLSVTPTDGVNAEAAETVTLTCMPDGGTHPDPTAACKSLWKVGGDFSRLPTRDGMACTEEIDPHTARATGHWNGSPVSYQETFSNRCRAAVDTDLVFAF